MMIKRKISFRGILNIKWVLASMLLTCSCTEELPIQEPTDRETVLQLSVSVEDSGFSSDSEMTPMNTRSETKPYVVTRIIHSTLLILKKVNGDQWVMVEKKDDVLTTPNNYELMSNEKLSLNNDAVYYTLLPGTYQFLLLVNARVSSDIPMNQIITDDFPLATTANFPQGDFFFAKDEIVLTKMNNLNQVNTSKKAELVLKRNSALIRFILEGFKPVAAQNTSITYKTEGVICTGVNVLGEMVKSYNSSTWITETKWANSYTMLNKSWLFSESSSESHCPLLFADEQEANINITITNIGYKANLEDIRFDGEHEIKNVSIKKNCITTILLRPAEGVEGITHEINPDVKSWNNELYPPFNYVELNNKDK